MPQLPQLNPAASPFSGVRSGTLDLPRPSPDVYGHHGYEDVAKAGESLTEFGHILQTQQDELDLSRLVNGFNTRLSDHYNSLLYPDLEAGDEVVPPHQRAQALQAHADTVVGLLKKSTSSSGTPVSAHVQQALQLHADRAVSEHAIHLTAESYKLQAEQIIVGKQQEADRWVDQAAADLTRKEEYLKNAKGQFHTLLHGTLITPEKQKAGIEHVMRRYYSLVAEQRPEEMLLIAEDPTRAPSDMNKADIPQFVNLALSAMAARNYRTNVAEKAKEKEIKAVQDENSRKGVADLLQGNRSVIEKIPDMLRKNQIDTQIENHLRTVDKALREPGHFPNYDSKVAPTLENNLRKIRYGLDKYQGEDINKQLNDSGIMITDLFTKHVIDQDEYRRLMPLLDTVRQEHQSQAQTARNEAVRSAHQVINGFLTVTGIMNFDPLANLLQNDARKYFDAQLATHPNATVDDVRKFQEDTERIFRKPLAERKKVSGEEGKVLEEAQMQARYHLGAISKPTYEAFKGQRQVDLGNQIVQDTLAAIPPPPEKSAIDKAYDIIEEWKKAGFKTLGYGPSQPPITEEPAPVAPKPEKPKPRKKSGIFGD